MNHTETTQSPRNVRKIEKCNRSVGCAGKREIGAVRVRVLVARGRPEGGADIPVRDPMGEEHNAGRIAGLLALVVVRLLGPVLCGTRTTGSLRTFVRGQGVPRLRIRQLGLRRQRHWTQCGTRAQSTGPAAAQRGYARRSRHGAQLLSAVHGSTALSGRTTAGSTNAARHQQRVQWTARPTYDAQRHGSDTASGTAGHESPDESAARTWYGWSDGSRTVRRRWRNARTSAQQQSGTRRTGWDAAGHGTRRWTETVATECVGADELFWIVARELW